MHLLYGFVISILNQNSRTALNATLGHYVLNAMELIN